MIDKIKKKGALIIIALLATITAMSTISVRDSVIKEHDWKVTSGASLKNDFIYFSEDSAYSYSCPLIRENGEIIAMASPYAYCMGNPVKYVDPDGRKSLLIIWASNQQHYGHAAFAIQNYSSDHTPLNTYNVYGLFPYNSYSSTDAVYDKKERGLFFISNNKTLNQIKCGKFLSGENYKPDGILEIQSDYEHDENTRNAMQEGINLNQGYKGVSRNCSTYAREGVRKAIGNNNLRGEESILFVNFVTPNQLYKETKLKDNVKIIIDAEDKVDYKIDDCMNILKK